MPESSDQTPRNQRTAASETLPLWQEMLLLVVFRTILPSAVLTFITGFVLHSEFGLSLGPFLFWVVVFSIIFLPEPFESRAPIAYAFFSPLSSAVWWLLLTIYPVFVSYYVSKLALVSLSLFAQVIVFVVWGLLLAALLLLITTERHREGFFKHLRELGRFTPFLYSFSVLFIAIIFFSFLTYVLVEQDLLSFSGPTERNVSLEALFAFYLWHFLESLPLLTVNETLHWEKPLTYHSFWVGLALLMFKVTVIAPVISAFAGYWAYLGKERNEDE